VQLVVSIRHIENPPPQGLGAARVPLAEIKHKRTLVKELFEGGGTARAIRRGSISWWSTRRRRGVPPYHHGTSCFRGNPQQL